MATTRKGGFNNAQKADEAVETLGYLNISLITVKGTKRIGKFGIALKADDAVSKAIAQNIKSGKWTLEQILAKLELSFTEAVEKLDSDDIEI